MKYEVSYPRKALEII